MKKAIVVLLLVLSAAVLFAETRVQTIVLVSVVERVTPNFSLEVEYVENGYAHNTSSHEVEVFTHDVDKNVQAHLVVWQDLSRYAGDVKITVSATELWWNGFHTEGLQISGRSCDVLGRTGQVSINNNSVVFNVNYTGKCILESPVAEVTVDYQGNSQLPRETYVSQISMVIESK